MKNTIILLYFIFSVSLIEAKEKNVNPDVFDDVIFNHPNYKSNDQYIANNLRFPNTDIEYKTTGVLLSGLRFNSEGEIIEVFCLNSLSNSINSHVLDFLNKSAPYWEKLDDSITIKKFKIIPIVFEHEYLEYYIKSENIKFDIVDEVVICAQGLGTNLEMKYKPLKRKLTRQIKKQDYKNVVYTLKKLIVLDPFNARFYSDLIKYEVLVGNFSDARKNLELMELIFIEKPEIDSEILIELNKHGA